MATLTANYNLRKPAGGDFVTVAADINASMDTIDAQIKARQDEIDATEARLTALEPGGSANFFVNKPATQNKSTNTTFGNDNALVTPNLQPGTYDLEYKLLIAGDTAADFQSQLVWTGTMTLSGFTQNFPAGATSLSDTHRVESFVQDSTSPSFTSVAGTITGSNTYQLIKCTAVVTVAGIITLQWCQNVSNATNTQVLAGSTLRGLKVA